MSEAQKSREIEMLLAAYRPDGSDAADPDMAEALARVEEDADLRALFEESCAFDAAVSAVLADVPVPVGLRDEIAAASGSGRRKRNYPLPGRRLLAVAAVLAVSLLTTFFFVSDRPDPSWVQAPLGLLQSVYDGETPPDLSGATPGDTLEWLEDRFDASMALPVSLATLPSKKCTFRAGPEGKIAVVCFDGGSGTTVHLLIQEDPAAGFALPETCCRSEVETWGGWETLTWGTAGRRYVLAANARSEACCKRLRQLAGIGV